MGALADGIRDVYRRYDDRVSSQRGETPVAFVSEVAKAVSLSFHYYLPTQNLEKIVDRMSVVVMAPVMDER